jgi:prefoldin subunit 5
MSLGWDTFGWAEKEFEKSCQIIKTRRNDIQRQSEKIKEKISLVSFWNMKQEWGR